MRNLAGLWTLERKREAFEAAAAAESAGPADAATLDAIGGMYSAVGEYERALALFEKAVAAAPASAQYLFNLAATLRFLGQLDRAEHILDRVIELAPDDAEAYWLRSGLRRQTLEANHIHSLERALVEARDGARRTALYYALGKEYEDLERHDISFECFSAGASSKRKAMVYDVAADIEAIDAIARHHTRAALARMRPGLDCSSPIFVIGMPRSGTTLVERILASHSQVASVGESQNFTLSLLRLAQGPHRPLTRAQLIERSLQVSAASLGGEYLQRTDPEARAADRFVDKLPLNFLYAGLIHAALPGAKIVHVVRDPMDACYAMYKTLFATGYPFSYDLLELGRYYVAYRRLMEHWRQTLPEAIIDVHYEDVIADTAGQARRMLSFCGLAMEERCIAFHRNPGATTTASAAQVRQPIYATSIGRWRRVERHLVALRCLLAEQDCLGIPAA